MPRRRPLKPEYPRSEPEIIPPARDRTQAYGQGQGSEWFANATQGSSRVFVARFGTWKILGIVLLIGLVAGAVLAILLGALLIMVPVIGLLVIVGIIASQLRGSPRRPR
jgi:hypothetical protein